MDRLTEVCWRNLDPWECCGQDNYCRRDCHENGGCTGGCVVPKLYARLAAYEDTGLTPDGVTGLIADHEIAIKKLEEYRIREEKKAPKCYIQDTDGGCRYLVPDGDDEPIDRCKKCPLCYSDKQRHRSPSNDPLTLEELREIDGEPVFVTSAIGEHPMWYIVDTEENELKNPWDRITLEEWDDWYPYKAYRRKPKEG